MLFIFTIESTKRGHWKYEIPLRTSDVLLATARELRRYEASAYTINPLWVKKGNENQFHLHGIYYVLWMNTTGSK